MPAAIRLLLVDDDEDSFVHTRGILRRACGDQYQLDWEATYAGGLRRLREPDYQACLLDYHLGEETGLAFLQRAVDEGCRVPIIMLTGQTNSDLDQSLLQAGAADYLLKGADGATISRSVRYAIERARVERERSQADSQRRLISEALGATLWSVNERLERTSQFGPQLFPPELSAAETPDWLEQHAPLLAAAQRRALRGEHVSTEITLGGRVLHAHLNPLPGPTGAGAGEVGTARGLAGGVVGLALDITDRKQVEAEAERVAEEFRQARRVQEHMLPHEAPRIEGLDIAGVCHPADETGGDLYDYITFVDGSLGLVVADVSHHGFSSALVMSATRRVVRTLAAETTDLAHILTRVNDAVREDVPPGMFVTMFLARVDLRQQLLHYASAGHEAYWFEPGQEPVVLDGGGTILGPFEESYASGVPLPLRPGQLLLINTDGFYEAQGPTGQLGLPPMLGLVTELRAAPAEQLLSALATLVRNHCGSDRPQDDMTAVLLKVGTGPWTTNGSNQATTEATAATARRRSS